VNRIVASLKYGRIWKKGIIFWWVTCLLGVFFLALGLLFLFEPNKNVAAIIGTFVCFVAFFSLALYMIIKNYINVIKCREWMKDAIELDADTKGVQKVLPGITDLGLRKLEVSFRISGKKYVLQSGTKKSNGYDRIFSRFVDRKIRILYSLKYNEAMILDDK